MTTLYHGSNVEIHDIDLSYSKKGKDFGCGFYLNPDREQSEKMADRITRLRMAGHPTVTAFAFDETVLGADANLKVKVFSDYCVEWAEFVLMNRSNASDKWDMIKAMDELYLSETYRRLCDPACGLFYESAVYVFSFLKKRDRNRCHEMTVSF